MAQSNSSKMAANTPTPHIGAKKSEIAQTVILPGDPERAEWAAKKFLKDAKLVTDIRGIKGFTGAYNGKRVTIMASGMGAPSAGIYIYELYNFYGVQKIIRTGTCGGMQKNVKPGDLIFAMSASTDSSFANQYALSGTFSPCADFELLQNAVEFATKNKFPSHIGMVFSSNFFSSYNPQKTWKAWAAMGALGQDMETYALYCNAAAAGKKALSILTTTINLHTRAQLPCSQEIAAPMMKAALSLI